jgi:hypothetical protein
MREAMLRTAAGYVDTARFYTGLKSKSELRLQKNAPESSPNRVFFSNCRVIVPLLCFLPVII